MVSGQIGIDYILVELLVESIEVRRKIQLRNIRYNEDRGEVSLELSPKYAYFIDWSNNNNDPRSLIYSYSEIRVESSVGKIAYSGEEILNAFQYDEDCECFLMTLK